MLYPQLPTKKSWTNKVIWDCAPSSSVPQAERERPSTANSWAAPSSNTASASFQSPAYSSGWDLLHTTRLQFPSMPDGRSYFLLVVLKAISFALQNGDAVSKHLAERNRWNMSWSSFSYACHATEMQVLGARKGNMEFHHLCCPLEAEDKQNNQHRAPKSHRTLTTASLGYREFIDPVQHDHYWTIQVKAYDNSFHNATSSYALTASCALLLLGNCHEWLWCGQSCPAVTGFAHHPSERPPSHSTC